MKKRIASLCVSLLVSPSLWATSPDAGWQPAGPSVLAALDVDATGHVAHAELVRQGSLPQFQELMQQTVRSWSFVPATVDGKQVPARTYAVLEPEMLKNGDQISLRFRYVSHGPGRVTGQQPFLTPDMISRHLSARIVVDATVGGDGEYKDIRTETVEISNGKSGKELSLAVEKAISTWRALPETVNGQAVATRVRLPFSFSIARTGTIELPIGIDPASVARTRDSDASHVPDDSAASRLAESGSPGTEPVALDSPLKLIATSP